MVFAHMQLIWWFVFFLFTNTFLENIHYTILIACILKENIYLIVMNWLGRIINIVIYWRHGYKFTLSPNSFFLMSYEEVIWQTSALHIKSLVFTNIPQQNINYLWWILQIIVHTQQNPLRSCRCQSSLTMKIRDRKIMALSKMTSGHKVQKIKVSSIDRSDWLDTN